MGISYGVAASILHVCGGILHPVREHIKMKQEKKKKKEPGKGEIEATV